MGRLGRLGLAAVGLAVGIVAVFALREATLSTHEEISPDSRAELIVSARQKSRESGQTIDEKVEALLLSCRLEVNSDFVGRIENQGNGRFRAVLQPALDDTNKRQFRGCVEDWTVEELLVSVVRLEDAPDADRSS